MGQIFRPSTNTIARTSIGVLVLLLAFLGWLAYALMRSPYVTLEGVVRQQPIPFSHQHHVAGLGIDCRYCHTTVETSSFAGMPTTSTCMQCHSQIWSDAPMLKPVRDSYRNDTPLAWRRVNNLPDYVYFDHSIHVNKGVGCATCHGRVDQMPLMAKGGPLTMAWCLDCHRAPEKYLRPRDEVFNMAWAPPGDQPERGAALVEHHGIKTEALADCWICHR